MHMAARAAAIGANIAIGAMRRYGPRLAKRVLRRKVGVGLVGAAAAASAANALASGRRTRKRAAVKTRKSKLPRRFGPGPSGGVYRDEGAGYNQQQYHTAVKGRRISSQALVQRTVMAGAQREIFQWRNYAVDSTASPNLSLTLSHTVGVTERQFPLYLFDLTGRIQNIAGSPLSPTVCLRPYCDVTGAADGKVKWAVQNTLDSTGGGFSPYLQRTEGTTISSSASQTKSFLEWVDMRFNIMGPTARPTKVTLTLVKLMDDEYDPWITDGTSATSGSTHQVFWQSVLAPLTVNNIHNYTRPARPGFKVLANKTFEFQPISSTESDTRGHIQTLKWFWRANRMLNYANGGVEVTDDASYSSRFIPNASGGRQSQCLADSSQRIFLMVRAYCPNTGATFDRTVHPSFEANLRMKHTTMA